MDIQERKCPRSQTAPLLLTLTLNVPVASASLLVTHPSGWDHPIPVTVLVGCAQRSPSLRLMSGPLPKCDWEMWRIKCPKTRAHRWSPIMDRATPTPQWQAKWIEGWKQPRQFHRGLLLVSILFHLINLSYSATMSAKLALSQETWHFVLSRCDSGLKYCSVSLQRWMHTCINCSQGESAFCKLNLWHRIHGLVWISLF